MDPRGEDPRLTLLLALADDELIIGPRHSEWTGWASHIEEDLAFSSIAQDEMAHARLLYGLAREAGLDGRDENAMALGRRPEEYRNAVLCERPNRDWGYTLAQHFLYDTADQVRLEAASLDFVFERHAPATGEMVPTSSGAIEGEAHPLTVPGVVRRDGRWVHEGEFVGAGGRRGRHSEDFLPLWEEMTNLYRTHPG